MKTPSKPAKPPRPLTYCDLTMMRGFSVGEVRRLVGSNSLAVAHGCAKIDLANAMNDMVPSLNGFDQLPYLPGDMILCKLNVVTLKQPRRNPWFKA